jgi:hypothetical protein
MCTCLSSLSPSVRKEAAFASRLGLIGDPAPAEERTDRAMAEKTADGGIEWEKLIDLGK